MLTYHRLVFSLKTQKHFKKVKNKILKVADDGCVCCEIALNVVKSGVGAHTNNEQTSMRGLVICIHGHEF